MKRVSATVIVMCCAVSMVLMILSASASAAEFLYETTDIINSFTGEKIGETIRLQKVFNLWIEGDNVTDGYYTATFSWDEEIAYEVFTSSEPGVFWGDQGATYTAATALMNSIHDRGDGGYTIDHDPSGSRRDYTYDNFFIPFAMEQNYEDYYWLKGYRDENPLLDTDVVDQLNGVDISTTSPEFFVTFAGATSVPLPSSLWLLGLSLLTLLGIRKRIVSN